MEEPIDRTIKVFQEARQCAQDPSDQALLSKQVEALNAIRATLARHGAMRYQIDSFEKLISDPWMNDQMIFAEVYGAWKTFKNSYVRKIGGMTVNERLFHMGLLADFEASEGDASRMRSILRAVFLSSENIEAIVKPP